MKIIIWMMAVILLSGACRGYAEKDKQPLKILFVGNAPEKGCPPQNFIHGAGIAESRYVSDMKKRMPAFMQLLKSHFIEVRGIDARDYTEQMTAGYDVVIFDAVPAPVVQGIKDAGRRQPDTSRLSKEMRRKWSHIVDTKEVMSARYFSEGYDKPTLFIGDRAGIMGAAIGLKLNWFCRCLDAHAYDVEEEHPIFHGPFPVCVSYEERIAPTSALTGAEGVRTPGVMKMWRVQTEGYREGGHERYRQGLVAFGDGFGDSPDVEKITGGVSDKSRSAVAIARHGNFMMWGFAASPDYMTIEAQQVFLNAVCYIARFQGQQPVARKYVNGWVSREKMRAELCLFDKEAYMAYVAQTKAYNKKLDALKEEVENLKAAMQAVPGDLLSQAWPAVRQVLGREAFLENYLKRSMTKAGCRKLEEYRRYLTENMDYFYGGKGDFSFSVDDDLKQLRIPMGQTEILDKAVALLEGNEEEKKMGKRLLQRYTFRDFVSAEEWRRWLGEVRSALFFSESCGYKFFENRNASFSSTVVDEEGIFQENPVKATAVRKGNEVIVRIAIRPGFHIYADTGEEGAYILTKVDFSYPDGIRAAGKLLVPESRNYAANPKIRIYEGNIEFRQPVEGKNEGKLMCTLTYQACDETICLPPVTEQIEVSQPSSLQPESPAK